MYCSKILCKYNLKILDFSIVYFQNLRKDISLRIWPQLLSHTQEIYRSPKIWTENPVFRFFNKKCQLLVVEVVRDRLTRSCYGETPVLAISVISIDLGVLNDCIHLSTNSLFRVLDEHPASNFKLFEHWLPHIITSE